MPHILFIIHILLPITAPLPAHPIVLEELFPRNQVEPLQLLLLLVILMLWLLLTLSQWMDAPPLAFVPVMMITLARIALIQVLRGRHAVLGLLLISGEALLLVGGVLGEHALGASLLLPSMSVVPSRVFIHILMEYTKRRER